MRTSLDLTLASSNTTSASMAETAARCLRRRACSSVSSMSGSRVLKSLPVSSL